MIKCVPRSYGFAHVCDECGTVGPIRGDFPEARDRAEMQTLGLRCDGNNDCSAREAGWQVGVRDLCPTCRTAKTYRGNALGPTGDAPQAGGLGRAFATLCGLFRTA